MNFFLYYIFVFICFSNINGKRRRKIIDPLIEALNFKHNQNDKSNPVEAILNTLQNVILQKDPPKGEEFSKIPGPSKNDKVKQFLNNQAVDQ